MNLDQTPSQTPSQKKYPISPEVTSSLENRIKLAENTNNLEVLCLLADSPKYEVRIAVLQNTLASSGILKIVADLKNPTIIRELVLSDKFRELSIETRVKIFLLIYNHPDFANLEHEFKQLIENMIMNFTTYNIELLLKLAKSEYEGISGAAMKVLNTKVGLESCINFAEGTIFGIQNKLSAQNKALFGNRIRDLLDPNIWGNY